MAEKWDLIRYKKIDDVIKKKENVYFLNLTLSFKNNMNTESFCKVSVRLNKRWRAAAILK